MAVIATAPAPAAEVVSEFYRVQVDGQEVPVYSCRVSAVPFNQVWPGYQRPLDQTELAGFATWDAAGAVTVTIQSTRDIQQVVVRPRRLGMVPQVTGRQITFTLSQPEAVVVEVNGPAHALHLFGCPPATAVPAPDAPNVLYFGPGVHRPGVIQLRDHQTVYLAPGAVVYGSLHGQGVRDVRIAGRGILDQSPFARGEGGGAIRLSDCSEVTIEGLILRDPDVWCCSLFGCRNVRLSGLKLIGLWRYNADGIDVCNSSAVVVEDCFVRAFDDALVVKGLPGPFVERPVANVTFRRCTVWCDWGRALEIGAETCAPEIGPVTFEDCDIVRTTHIALDIQHGDQARIHDIRFQRLRLELDDRNPRPRLQTARDEVYADQPGHLPALAVIIIRGTMWTKTPTRGTVRDVLIDDLAIWAPRMPGSSFDGHDATFDVSGVTCTRWRLNGAPLTSPEAYAVRRGPHVDVLRLGD
ncbi:MAG: hypothetical protein IT204_25700 [Fimbriimonadaceae bacterium]|nr:hypothetical protein [Fimbriimonadaceae bacterium]